jgi:probable F420-dependent oxidoreductase
MAFSRFVCSALAAADAHSVGPPATTTLRIGSNVLANDFYHSIMLGREIAAVDALTNGRLVLGLGTGFYRPDYDQSGITFDSPAIRVGRLEEAIQIIKGIFTTTPFSFTGHHYTIRDVVLPCAPIQQPHPPLLIGGASPRILALAAREADIVSFNIRTTVDGGFDTASLMAEPTAQKVAWVQQAANARWEHLECSIFILRVSVTNDRLRVAQEIADGWSHARITPSQVLESPHVLIGSVDEIIADIYDRRTRYGISHLAIFDDKIDVFSPIVAQLAGK